MNLVARKDFFNVKNLGITLDPKARGVIVGKDGKADNAHIPKGYRFQVGTATVFKDLTQDQKVVVSQIMVSQCAIIDDGSPESKSDIAKLELEIVGETEAIQKAKAATPLSIAEQIAIGVKEALIQAGVKVPAK